MMPTRSNSNNHSQNQPELYWFKTKTGTTLSTFQAYVKTLPDCGNGDQVIIANLPWQTYITRLTAAEAEDVAKQPFVQFVWPLARDEDAP